MQEPSDTELLRQYTGQNSEEAFAALVSRHVNLVYSAALRKTGNCHVAQEITQAVFIILAKKAPGLRKETILPGWLYQTARLTAANFLRNEIRRIHREQEACMQSPPNEPEPWPQIVPLLEDAMGQLSEKERNAIVLRFFEGKSFQEIGTAFGASENAAKKRVTHGLEKLRKFLFRRGVNSTPDAIAGAISANSMAIAPAGLAQTISAVAVAKGAAASTSTLILVKGALKIMAWSNAKTAVVAGTAAVVLVAATATVVFKASNARSPRSGTQSFNLSLNGTDSIPQIQMGDTIDVNNREHLKTDSHARTLSATVWPKETQAMKDKIKAGQQTNMTTNAVRIDLSAYVNAKLTDGPIGGQKNNLAELPLGVNIYGGVPFDVKGVVYLMGGGLAKFNKVFPEEVDNIRIGCRCRKIYLFHGEQYIFYGDWGNTVSKLILHYEDGSTNELNLVAGKNAFDFWAPLFSTGVSPANLNGDPETVPAWAGSNHLIQSWQPDESLVLLRSSFDNPQPDLALESVDYVSNDTMAVPMLLGLTVE